jgi:hypothetical protein
VHPRHSGTHCTAAQRHPLYRGTATGGDVPVFGCRLAVAMLPWLRRGGRDVRVTGLSSTRPHAARRTPHAARRTTD